MMNSMNWSGIAFCVHVRLSRSQLVAIEFTCTEAQLMTKFVSTKRESECKLLSKECELTITWHMIHFVIDYFLKKIDLFL